MKKRIISLLLCLVMVVGLLPVTAHADIVQEDMDAYAGKRITKVELKASVDSDNYAPAGVTNDSYNESRNITVGTPVKDSGKDTSQRIKFEVTSMTYTNEKGGTPTTITNDIPLKILNNGLRWKTGAVPHWEWVDSDATYLACQYCYMIILQVKDDQLGGANGIGNNGYRIDPDVEVTVNWTGSNKGVETCNVDEKYGVSNDNDVKYGFVSSYVSATTADFTVSEDGVLRLSPAGVSIPAGFGNEAIKPISLAFWAKGGQKPYTFSKESGPNWINVSLDGKITGTPTAADATTLKVKVTDATGATATADISVGEMKAARTVIQSVEITGLSYPRVGDVIPQTPNVSISKITAADGTVISKADCPLRLTISREWKDEDGKAIYSTNEDYATNKTFEAGKGYRFVMQIRLEGKANCEKYYLPESFTAIVPNFVGGEEGSNKMTVSPTSYTDDEKYISLFVQSPKWEAVNTGNILEGTVSYSGAARYNQKLTANVTDLPTGVTESDLSYQWQVKHNNYDIWYDIDDATNAQLPLNDDDLVGRQIRVTARCTGTNYAGMLFGAPVTVGKNWNMGIPEKPVIEYNAANSKLTITDASWKSNAEMNPQEYAWTTSLTRDETTGYAVWPTSNQGTDKSLLPVTAGQTYYVYTRVKGSKTMEPGRIISAVAYTVPFADGSSSGGESGAPTSIWANDMVYPDYDSKTPTIYLKKGEQITVRYQLDPNNADANLPQWKETYNAADSTSASVTVNNDTDTKTLTITAGNKTGTVYVVAYRDANAEYPVNWYGNTPEGTTDGRQITVEIYDPEDPASVPFVKAYLGTTELYVNDTYEITKAALLDLPFVPADVEKNNYTLAAMFTNYGTGGSSGVITRSDTNDFVSLNNDTEKFVIKGEAETLSGSSVYVEFFALPGNEVAVEDYGRYAIAALSVTVKDRPAVPTRTATVSPNALSLLAGESYQLQAYMTPAETGDSFTWVSSDTNVATVDSTGKVTVAAGATASSTATITATCGEGDAAVSANCVITVKAGCGDNHTYEYLESGWGHVKVCIFCDKSDNVILDHRMSWLESTETAGKMYGECADCGYRTGLMDIPANETPADPTPDNPNNPDSPSTPNRPNLPNLPDSSSGGHHSSAGRPYRPDLSTAVPEGTTAAKPNSDVKSPGTGDAGIMLYAALSLMSMTGGAWLVSKKRRDR